MRRAGKDKNESILFLRRIGTHAIGKPGAAQIGHIHAGAGAVIAPAMIAAAQGIALHRAQMQRDLAMGTAVFQGKDAAALAAIQRNRGTGEFAADDVSRLDLIGPCQWIPVIGMQADAAQIGGAPQMRADR